MPIASVIKKLTL